MGKLTKKKKMRSQYSITHYSATLYTYKSTSGLKLQGYSILTGKQ